MIGAGELRDLIDFQRREEIDDGYGNVVSGPYATFLTVPANIRTLRGGETVIAGRLQGTQALVLTMRWQPELADLGTGVQAVNGRNGTIYNVRSITIDDRRSQVEMLVESGVA